MSSDPSSATTLVGMEERNWGARVEAAARHTLASGRTGTVAEVDMGRAHHIAEVAAGLGTGCLQVDRMEKVAEAVDRNLAY